MGNVFLWLKSGTLHPSLPPPALMNLLDFKQVHVAFPAKSVELLNVH